MEVIAFIQELRRKSEDHYKVWMEILIRCDLNEGVMKVPGPLWLKKTKYYRIIDFGISLWANQVKTHRLEKSKNGLKIVRNDDAKPLKVLQEPSASEPALFELNTNQSVKKTKITKKKSELYPNEVYVEIIEFLNQCSGKGYRLDTVSTRNLITSRLEEGYTVDDFKTVIEVKCRKWLGTPQETFLRPETLFSNKFESYRNETISQEKSNAQKTYEQLSEVQRIRSNA